MSSRIVIICTLSDLNRVISSATVRREDIHHIDADEVDIANVNCQKFSSRHLFKQTHKEYSFNIQEHKFYDNSMSTLTYTISKNIDINHKSSPLNSMTPEIEEAQTVLDTHTNSTNIFKCRQRQFRDRLVRFTKEVEHKPPLHIERRLKERNRLTKVKKTSYVNNHTINHSRDLDLVQNIVNRKQKKKRRIAAYNSSLVHIKKPVNSLLNIKNTKIQKTLDNRPKEKEKKEQKYKTAATIDKKQQNLVITQNKLKADRTNFEKAFGPVSDPFDSMEVGSYSKKREQALKGLQSLINHLG